jgi:hypothetical protein
LNAQRVFAHSFKMLPEVLDLGTRAVRKRLKKAKIVSIFSAAFDGASDSLDKADETSFLLDAPPSPKETLEMVGSNEKYLMNIIATNNHRVAASSKAYDSYNI